MGNTCKPLAVSFQCMTKSTTNKKKKMVKKKRIKRAIGLKKKKRKKNVCYLDRKSVSHVQLFVTQMDYAVHGILQARILEVGHLSLLQGTFPTKKSNSGLPHSGQILYQLSQKEGPNTGVVRLPLLQWIFPAQEANQGLLHHMQILYQ